MKFRAGSRFCKLPGEAQHLYQAAERLPIPSLAIDISELN